MYVAHVEDDEHVEVREVIRDLIATLCPKPKIRAAIEMGLVGLTIPVGVGGGGATVAELAIGFQETASTLLPSLGRDPVGRLLDDHRRTPLRRRPAADLCVARG